MADDTVTPLFIGDEVSAAGYRLGGVQVRTPSAEETPEVFRRALEESELLLVSVEAARHIPASELHAALRSPRPLVLVVPDVRERLPVRDLASRLRRELGVEP